jgi:hypothetical protein
VAGVDTVGIGRRYRLVWQHRRRDERTAALDSPIVA